MLSKELWMRRIRNIVGLMGMILPWFCLLGYYIAYKRGSSGLTEPFPDSMSITYYVTPVLSMVLTTASIVLMTYAGYDWRDRLVTTLSGVFGLFIVLFPCSDTNGVFEAMHIHDTAGYFQTPVTVNPFVHNVSAVMFFLLLAFNSFFLFTLSEQNPTQEKKVRNMVYKICAIGMLVAMLFQLIPVNIPHKTFWIEAVALTFFGISWLTKGELWLKDKEEMERIKEERLKKKKERESASSEETAS